MQPLSEICQVYYVADPRRLLPRVERGSAQLNLMVNNCRLRGNCFMLLKIFEIGSRLKLLRAFLVRYMRI